MDAELSDDGVKKNEHLDPAAHLDKGLMHGVLDKVRTLLLVTHKSLSFLFATWAGSISKDFFFLSVCYLDITLTC